MGCEGCFSSQQELDKAISNIRNKAKAFSESNETTVYLYMDSNNQPAYMAEQAARQYGIVPTLGVVSYLRQTTPA